VTDTDTKTAAADAATQSNAGSATEDVDEVGLFDNVLALSRDLELLAREQLELATLEARVATRSVIVMIAGAVAVGVLFVSVWLVVVALLVWVLLDAGMTPLLGFVAVAALNLLAGWILVVVIRRNGRNLSFPATRRSLATLIEMRRGAAQ
jgi:hypothetical protein